MLCLTSAMTGVWCYLFEQAWLHTILMSSYYGHFYTAFVAVIAGVLCDIAFNRGRVLRLLMDALASAVSHTHV